LEHHASNAPPISLFSSATTTTSSSTSSNQVPPRLVKFASAKSFFITCPQNEMDKHQVCSSIVSKFKDLRSNKLTYVCVSQECHENPNEHHLHILITFAKKKQFSQLNFLSDILGKHANYQSARYPLKVKIYITKHDKHPAEYGKLTLFTNNTIKPISKVKNRTECYQLALESITEQEALTCIRKHSTRDYVLWYDKLVSNLKQHYKNVNQSKYARTGYYVAPKVFTNPFYITIEMATWLEEQFILSHRSKMLMLIGPSRIGKTAWARSLHPHHMYFRGTFNIDKWDDDARYIIFDDIPWKDTKSYQKQLFTAMGEVEITDRYRPKRTIETYKPCIYLTNEYPIFETQESKEYWKINATIVILTHENILYQPTLPTLPNATT
jgi:hypothetical protein